MIESGPVWAGKGVFVDAVSYQMLAVFAVIAAALVLYATERIPLELTSFATVCALLLFFHFAPVTGPEGKNLLSPAVVLSGFASPALLTVLALLVLGEGLSRTGVLDQVAVTVHKAARGNLALSLSVALVVVCVVSAVMNNIPVVVIFVPIMQSLAAQSGRSPSRYMMPLSYAAILGGMTTLIGSSTNLLVSNALVDLGEPEFDFFSFTVPGLVVAGVGMIYVLFIAPRLLPDKAGADDAGGQGGKQFRADIAVTEQSRFAGMEPVSGFFPSLKDVTLLSIHRDGAALLPPFDDLSLRPGDTLSIAATREALRNAVKDDLSMLHPDIDPVDRSGGDETRPWTAGGQSMAEIMVKPESRLIGRTLAQVRFRYRHNCVVIGIERRSRMQRQRVTDIPLEAGDILLIQGRHPDIMALRGDKDVILMEWSAETVPEAKHGKRAAAIFLAVVGCAASGLVPTEIAALTGAAVMVLAGALSLDDAIKALDAKVVFLIAAALSLGSAMHATGGAAFLAHVVLVGLGDASPAVVLGVFFLLVAALANILSTKATAVLFTPIGVGIARELGVSPEAFAVAVVFAANCSFASPVGYQTNLLVMAPGGYRFVDFVKTGIPLMLICWAAFFMFAPWYYGL